MVLVRVSVKDEGKGIPLADQVKLGNAALQFTTMGTSNEKGSVFYFSLIS